MQSVIFAKKGKTTQIFDSKLQRVPATILTTDDVFFVGAKHSDSSGYNSLSFAFGKSKSMDMPTLGKLKKIGITEKPAKLSELKFKQTGDSLLKVESAEGKITLKSGDAEVAQGAKVDATQFFKEGEYVDVTGVTKGKGFQGGVKRHRFAGGPKTHGQSDRWRAPGSVGATTTPGRTFKGQRMAGRMGGVTTTVKKLKILSVTPSSITVAGLVPGNVSGYVSIKSSN